MRVLIVFAIAVLSFACGGAPANNANHPANMSNTSNTNVTSTTMSSNTSSTTSNSMTNSSSTMASNSMANKSNTAVKSNSTTTATASNTVAGQVKGNKATKVYHLPGCPDYNSISPGNVVTFATEQEARKAGYKIAGNCK